MLGAAYVVGHGPGVGDATARAFAAQGRPVALTARNEARARAAAAALGDGAVGVGGDASDEPSLEAALEKCRLAVGPPDVLVYNTAFWRRGPVLGLSPDDWLADFRTDVVGAIVAARWAVPQFKAGSSLLFTGGGLALYPSADAPTLSVGKSAIRALALMLAGELEPRGIRVGTVTIAGTVGSPGLTPERVAKAFVELASGLPARGTAEIVLKP